MLKISNLFRASMRIPRASHRLSTCALSLAIALAVAGAAHAATELKAPVKMLMKGHNRVAVLQAAAKKSDSQIAFKSHKTLYGEPLSEVTLRLDETTYSEVEIDQTYVVAFSNIRRNFRFRELREVDPAGFRVLTILGGGPALLDDSPAVRLLFEADRAKELPPSADRLAAALTTLTSDDDRTRTFGALELSFRPEWIEQMEAEHVASLRRSLRDTRFGPNLRDRLLEVANKLPDARKRPWLAEETRRTLGTLEPQFDLTTFFPRLAVTAITILGAQGNKTDASLVAQFLEANNPGVVEAALEALDELDPDLARSRAAVVLKRQDLHAESRRVLTEYLG